MCALRDRTARPPECLGCVTAFRTRGSIPCAAMRLSLHEKRRDHFRHAFCLFNCLTSTRLNKRFFCFEYGEGSKISDYYKFAFSDEVFFFCIGEDRVQFVEGDFFAHDTVHGYCFICQKVYCRRKTSVARVMLFKPIPSTSSTLPNFHVKVQPRNQSQSKHDITMIAILIGVSPI